MRVFFPERETFLCKYVSNAFLKAGHTLVELQTESKSNVDGEADQDDTSFDPDLTPLHRAILEAELIVLNLNVDRELVMEVITFLKYAEQLEDVILVAVSTVMTWNSTSKSSSKTLSEKLYTAREASPAYKPVKLLESLIVSSAKEGLTTYVVAPGILYGQGEHEFHNLFKLGWLCELEALPVYKEGENLVPTIHVQDLANVIMALAADLPESPYIVAVDGARSTQKDIVQAISSGLGLGKIQHITEDSKVDTTSAITMADMKFGAGFVSALEFEWVAHDGLPSSFDLVRQEYTTERCLQPVRIFVHGPPGAGKSFYSAALSKKYHVPHIQLGEVIAQALAAEDELAEEIDASLHGTKEGVVEEKGEDSDDNNDDNDDDTDGTASTNEDFVVPQPDLSGSKPKIPLELLTRIVKRKLLSKPCVNKGFILDGYPRTYEEAQLLFSAVVADDDEGREEHDEETDKPDLDPSTNVSLIVSLDCSEKRAKSNFQQLPDEATVEDHNDKEGFGRRWAKYKLYNDRNGDTKSSPLAFHKDLEVLEISDQDLDGVDSTIQAISLYVDKGGKVFNYHPTPEEVALELQEAKEKKENTLMKMEKERIAKEEAEKAERAQTEAQIKIRKALVVEEEAKVVENYSLPLRSYLMQNVMPSLVDGLLDVCKAQPDDPIDYLAEYLFKCSVIDSQQ